MVRIRRRRIFRTETELGANLPHQSLLTIHLKLQFPLIEFNQRLTFPDSIADIRQYPGDASVNLGAQGAFFEREQRSYGLHVPLRGFLGDGVDMCGDGFGGRSCGAVGAEFEHPAAKSSKSAIMPMLRERCLAEAREVMAGGSHKVSVL